MPDETSIPAGLSVALGELAADVTDPSHGVAPLVARGRRRLRRRRFLSAAAAVVVLLAATSTGVVLHHGHRTRSVLVAVSPAQSPTPPGASASVTPAPSAGPSPLPRTRRLDLLAPLTQPILVVDRTGLALLSGRVRSELTGTAAAGAPGMSRDGRYLSWLTTSGARTDLHIRDTRTGATTLTPDVGAYAWSPAVDVLAACHTEGLTIVRPGSPSKDVASGYCDSPAFSADGTRLAVNLERHTLVYRLDATGETAGNPMTLPYSAGTPRFVGNGLLLWPDPSLSGSIAADGLMLTDINLSTLQAFPLTETLTYNDWIQPLTTPGQYVVVAGDDREAHDHKTPKVFVIPDDPTADNPPRLASTQSVTIPAKTSLLSIVVSLPEGTISTVTGADDPNLAGNTVDGRLGIQRGGPIDVFADFGPVAAVRTTSNGKVSGALVITAHELYLQDASGDYDLGPVGPASGDLPAYYSHVNPADLLAVPAGR